MDGYNNSDFLAQGNTLEGSFTPTQLFTGEDEVKTSAAPYATNQNIAPLTILAKRGGKLVPWNPAATAPVTGGASGQTEPAPEAFPVGIAAAGMDTRAGGYNGDTYGPYYCGGCFNPDLLVWPSALASLSYELKLAALEGWPAPFRIKRLL